jgi:hypothetical protein
MKKLILIIMGALCLVSCRKFLEEYSQTDVTPKSTRDFGEILTSDGYPGTRTVLQPWMVFLDDDVECYNGPTATIASINNASAVFQWQPDFVARTAAAGNDLSFNTWKNYYQLLLGANVVLQYLDNSIGAQQDKDQLKGEAYTLRAFYHFMLVNIYAKPYNDSTTTPDKSPGIPIRTSAGLSDGYLSRNTVKEVYAQIVNDLDSAIYLLDIGKKDQGNIRISHVAAHLLASRVYLYMENWEKTIEHADKVLQYHPQLMDLNNWGGIPDYDANPMVGQFNIETIWCYGQPQEHITEPYRIEYEISHDLANTFEESDQRAFIGFSPNPEFLKPYIPADISQMKYGSVTESKKMILPNSWRSAEAYLNRAEAYIQLYKTKGDANAATQALQNLNRLRAARIDRAAFTAWTLQPADQLLQLCRAERRRELFLEETHRWFDLRRYGMPSITHVFRADQIKVQTYRLPAKDPLYVIPIPDEVITRNPVLQQNLLFSGTRVPE